MRYGPIAFAAIFALFAPCAARAQDSGATPAWKFYSSPESCTISLLRDRAFVLLTINPEGAQGLRIHHPEFAIANNDVQPVVLTLGDRRLAFDMRGARSTDGTPGVIAGDRRDLREAFGSAMEVQVEIAATAAIAVNLGGLSEVLPQFDSCAAQLMPRDPETIVAVRPEATRMPSIRASDLQLDGATQREVAFRLSIAPDGRPYACEIVRSSGSNALDDQVCGILRTGARFKPARNAAGKPVASTYQSRVKF